MKSNRLAEMTNESAWCGSTGGWMAGWQVELSKAGRAEPGQDSCTDGPPPGIAVSSAGAREPFCRKTPNLGPECKLS